MANPYKTYARKCDKAMRRSKERCYIASGRRWRCTEDCSSCICCMEKRYDGTWEHFNPRFEGRREDDERGSNNDPEGTEEYSIR